MHLTSGLPLVWGSGDLGGGRNGGWVANWPRTRTGPVWWAVLPEAVRTHAGLLAVRGHSAHHKTISSVIARWTSSRKPRLRVMLLRDASEHPTPARSQRLSSRPVGASPYRTVRRWHTGDTPSNNSSPIWWGCSISPNVYTALLPSAATRRAVPGISTPRFGHRDPRFADQRDEP